ncbi:hypothetical protein TNCV_944191 [Trichonephila clavipes]|nr:hypothetical protein TNCV_944191 [Trichonephila clavipes]
MTDLEIGRCFLNGHDCHEVIAEFIMNSSPSVIEDPPCTGSTTNFHTTPREEISTSKSLTCISPSPQRHKCSNS